MNARNANKAKSKAIVGMVYKLIKVNNANCKNGVGIYELALPFAELACQIKKQENESARAFIRHQQSKIMDWLKDKKLPESKKYSKAGKKKASTEGSVKNFIQGSKIDPKKDEFLSSFEWRALRMMALKKLGAKCQCCGATPSQGLMMHVDHIKPRKTHPELALSLDNLQVLCEVCNHGKGNWDDTDWRKTPAEIQAMRQNNQR